MTPVILSTNPPASAINGPTNTALAVQTNAVIDLTTVTPSTFRVHDSTTGLDVPGSYSEAKALEQQVSTRRQGESDRSDRPDYVTHRA